MPGRTITNLLAFLCLAPACSSEAPDRTTPSMQWAPMETVNQALPEDIRVYAGQDDTMPLRAWYVAVGGKRSEIIPRIVISDDTTDNLETVSSFARDLNAHVVINGGYFVMNVTPARHAGLLFHDGDLIASATRAITRDSSRYEITRGAIGFTESHEPDIAWVSSRKGVLYVWDAPPPHKPGLPADVLDYDRAAVWPVTEALGAGPVLVVDGKINITSDQEGFFGTSIPRVHPRTAIGRKEDGTLLLMVVDGRQSASRGVYLEELALMMHGLGAVEAMNLDGGGSSTLVVNNTLINRPAGGTEEREVMSAIAIFSKPEQ